jgi:sugar O-acyltransferase (sialic acid O-acetyltransferase NeuD family)
MADWCESGWLDRDMRKLVIFGAGKIADVAVDLVSESGQFELSGFSVDPEYLLATHEWRGLPIVSGDELLERFPPNQYAAFVAIGYQGGNAVRAERIATLAREGYQLASLVSPNAHVARSVDLADNVMIMAGVSVQSSVRIGQGTIVFGNATVGHHATVGASCWIASGAVLGGGTALGDRCFVGLNATVSNDLSVGERSILGANTLLTKSVGEASVVIAPNQSPARWDADHFLRFANL